MKKMLITALLGVLLAAPAFAAPEKSVEPRAPFAGQIEFLLSQNAFESGQADLTAKILFTFDASNRIRILEVESQNPGLESFVVEKLEGRKVYVDQSLEGKRFVLPIRIAS